MYSILMVIACIVSVFLMIIVLMQASKGEGLAGTFGGSGNMGAMFGTRRTADFLSKGTWWLGGILAGLAIVTNLFFLPGSSTINERESIIQGSGQSIPETPTLPQQNSVVPQQNQTVPQSQNK